MTQVIGTADRKIHVVDLNNPGTIYRVGPHQSGLEYTQLPLTGTDNRLSTKMANKINRLFPIG